MKIINNINGIKANGHYAPAVLSHGLLFVSGQLPMVNGKVVEGGIEAQAKQSLANIDKILVAAGTAREHVVSCHVYVSDIADWDAVNDVYAAYFGRHTPARIVVPSNKLHHGARIEIEVVAEMPE